MQKKYQIYGVGNALVDFEVEVTLEALLKHQIDKGVMSLIDETRQDELFELFKDSFHARTCGGSAANTIIGAQSLGSQCFYSCKVAQDETGYFYRDDLLKHGVHSNLKHQTLAEGKTGKCLVLVTEDADRTMNTFLGVTADISYQQIDEDALLNSNYLYIEGYLASSPIALETSIKAMQLAKSKGIKTAFSLSDPNMVKFCGDGLKQIIGDGVDILFCNYDEASLYAQVDNLEDAIGFLSKLAKTLVITLGAQGALIYNQGESIQIDAHSVTAVDTNGAGDLFAGSFLHALCQGATFEQAGKLASFASAQLVTEFGPRLGKENLEKVKGFAVDFLD